MKTSIRERIYSIIRKELNIDTAKLDSREIWGKALLDCVRYVAILTRVENELKLKIPITALKVITLNQFIDIVDSELYWKR